MTIPRLGFLCVYIYMYIHRAVASYLPKIGSGGYGLNAIRRREVRILLARTINFSGDNSFVFNPYTRCLPRVKNLQQILTDFC